MRRKLRIGRVLLGTVVLAQSRWRSYSFAAVGPFLLMVPVTFSRDLISPGIPLAIVYSIISYFIVATIAFSYHRISLLGSNSTSFQHQFRLDRSKVLFVANVFFVAAVVAMPLLVIGGVSRLVFGSVHLVWVPILVPLGFYLSSRISVLVPARAIGHRLSLSEAWLLTRGNGLKIMLLVYALPFFGGLFIDKQEVAGFGYFLALLALSVAVFLLPFILLSMVYSELTQSEAGSG